VTGECEPVNGVVLGSVIALVAQQGPELGVAVGEFDAAPTEAGVYDGTGVGERSPSLPFQFEIKVPTTPVDPTTPTTTAAPGGTLPETGANGISSTTTIALGLLIVGLGLFVVAQVRRRQAPTTI
jgi:LPXTG-motif cell wall-anchored protein